MNLNKFIVAIKESIQNKRVNQKLIIYTRYIYNILIVLKRLKFINDVVVKHIYIKRGKELIMLKGLLIDFRFDENGINVIKNISLVKKNNSFFYKKKKDKICSTINKKFFITTNSGIFLEEELSLLKKGGKFLFSIDL